MVKLGGQLAGLIPVLAASPTADPTKDADFMSHRRKVAAALAAVTHDAHAAFAGGWGLAVMFALSGSAPALTMDIGWDANARHYEAPGS
jgi:hypothetical protein